MNTITIDQAIYERAESFPAKWNKFCGILKDAKDNDDERFNYIINK